MSEWIRCPNCGTVMTVTTNGYLCPMCGTALPVKILHMTSGTSPEVDAVPVVRCKNCKRYREYTYLGTQKVYVCERDRRKRIYDMKEDDFCSRGERR